MQSNTHGKHFVNEYYTVPGGLDPNYTEALLEIATGENVDVISPLSDEEVVTLSRSKQAFEDHGIAVVRFLKYIVDFQRAASNACLSASSPGFL